MQPDESQSSANLHSQTASSQPAAQFHNHVDRSQPATHSFIQLTNGAFIPISHFLSPSELKTLKDKSLNVEQGILDAKNRLFNNLAGCKRKFKEHECEIKEYESEIIKQYQCAQRELLQAKERVKLKDDMVSPIPQSNSEKMGYMQSSSAESQKHIPKTDGSMPPPSLQIKNQESKIENESHQIQSEQEDPCQMIESGLEDLCPGKKITENKNVTDIQGDKHLVPQNDNIKHESSLKQNEIAKKVDLFCSRNASRHEDFLIHEELVTDGSDNPYDLSSSFIGHLLKGSPVSSCFCDLSSTFMDRLVRTDQLQSTSETDFDAPNFETHQSYPLPVHDQCLKSLRMLQVDIRKRIKEQKICLILKSILHNMKHLNHQNLKLPSVKFQD